MNASDHRHSSSDLSALRARLARLSAILTRGILADLAKVSPETVRRWLAGQPPSLPSMCTLCLELGVSLDRLVSGIHPADPVRAPHPAHESLALDLSRPFAGPPASAELLAPSPSDLPSAAIEKQTSGWLLLQGPAHRTIIPSSLPVPPVLLVVARSTDGAWQLNASHLHPRRPFYGEHPSAEPAAPELSSYEHLVGRTFLWIPGVAPAAAVIRVSTAMFSRTPSHTSSSNSTGS